MTWFKVDDKFHSHAKVARLGDDTDALALWVVAGSWSADQLSDGWVPAFVARRLDPDYVRRASALVRVGLWEEADRDGEKGWLFHGWNEDGRQPTAEQVQQERALKAARQQRWRDKHRAASGRFDVDASTGSGDDDGPHDDAANRAVDGGSDAKSRNRAASTPPSTPSGPVQSGAGQDRESSRAVDASTRRLGDGGVDTAPTRPDPTINTKHLCASAGADDALFGATATTKRKRPDPMARFPEFWTIYPRKIGKPAAEKNWAKAVKGGANPQAIIDGAIAYALECRLKERDKIKYPQGWLTDGRWMDERDPPPTGPSAEAAQDRPEWCGKCNERTRMLDDCDQPERCPHCHSSTQKADTR